MRDAAAALHSGYAINFNKFYQSQAITVSFPTAMGLPFVYTLKTPVHVSMTGDVHVRSHPDFSSGSQKAVRIPEVRF